MVFKTKSALETKKIAEGLAKKILTGGQLKTAAILGLKGNLGAGKTTFTQGFFSGLGIKKRALSPTFIIMRRHRIPRGRDFKFVYHIDAYRISKDTNLEPLGFKEIFKDPKSIILIEWAENIKKYLPKKMMWINFTHGKKEGERAVKF